MLRISIIVLACFYFSSLNSQTPCDAGFAAGYPCNNVDLLSHLDSPALGGGEMNDLWGWTDPSTGGEYVLIGREAGTSFVNISNPLSPVYLGYLPSHTGNSIWRDIKVYNDYAFIVSEASGHGMQVFDLSQLVGVTSPQTFSETAFYGNFGNAHNIAINEESGFAYAVGSSSANGGLHIIDISNPLSPTVAGFFSADGYTHDAQIVNYIGPDSDYAGAEIAFACNEDEVTIVNVSDKTDTQLIASASYSNSFYTHQGWLTDDQEYFIVNDELDEWNTGNNTRTLIFNVQDLDNPSLIGVYTHANAAIDHNLYVHEGYVYEANYRAGLRILNASDVANGNLTEEAFFDVYPASNSTQFNGAWSVYPYFSSGVVAVSHIEDGLFLLQPDFKTYYLDSDNDGFGDDNQTIQGFNLPTGYAENGGDCEPSLSTVYPNAPGTGEGIDNNCDGEITGDELVALCVGDFNGDSQRTVQDLTMMLGEFGCTSGCSTDINSDDAVTIQDISGFLALFGIPCN